jgi:hypothetical protein
MTSPTAIDDRLTAVEEDNRRLRRLSIALIVITAILAGLAVALMFVASRYGLPGSTAQIVAARQFVMRDADGKVRGLWGTDEKGAVRLVLQDDAGQARMRLSLLDDGATGFALIDSAGHNRAVFAMLPDQSISLALADATGKTRSVLGLARDGSSSLIFTDRTGVPRTTMAVDARGIGTISASDRGQGSTLDDQPEDSSPADTSGN